MRNFSLIKCLDCGFEFTPTSSKQIRCSSCQKIHKKQIRTKNYKKI